MSVFNKNSPFFNFPDDMNLKQRLIYEAIRVNHDVLSFSFNDLIAELTTGEKNDESIPGTGFVHLRSPENVSKNIWTTIDCAYRLNELLEKLRFKGASKNLSYLESIAFYNE